MRDGGSGIIPPTHLQIEFRLLETWPQAMEIRLGRSFSALGKCSFNTPFSDDATTFVESTEQPSVILRLYLSDSRSCNIQRPSFADLVSA